MLSERVDLEAKWRLRYARECDHFFFKESFSLRRKNVAAVLCDLAGAADLNCHLLVAIGTISYTLSKTLRPE